MVRNYGPAAADPDLAGDACLPLFGLGAYPTIADAADALAATGAAFDPDPAAARVYDDLFPLYRESYRGLRPVFAALARRAAPG